MPADQGLIGPLTKAWGHIVLLAAHNAYNLPANNIDAITELEAATEHLAPNAMTRAVSACTTATGLEIQSFRDEVATLSRQLRTLPRTDPFDHTLLDTVRQRWAVLVTALDKELTGDNAASTDTTI